MSIWFLGWDVFALTHHLNPLFSDYLNHPTGINLMWNPARWTQALLVAPVTLAFGPVLAYNLSQVLGLTLSAAAAYLALVVIVGGRPGAFAGGLLYGFSPYMVGHAPIHSDFIFMPIPPLVLLAFHRVVTSPRASPRRWGVLLGLLGAAQFLAAEEVAATMALVTVLGVALLLLWRRVDTARLRRGLEASAVAAAVAGAILAVPIAYQFVGPAAVHGDFHGPGFYVSDLFGFVIPTSTLAAYPPFVLALSTRFAGGPTENTAYLGLPLLGLLAYTAWRWRGALLVRWSAALLGLTALLSLGPLLQAGGRVFKIPLPWLIFQFVPLYGDVLTSRLMAYAYLLAAVLLAWFLAHLDELAPKGRPLAWVLLGLVAVSLVPRAPLAPYRRDVPAFFTGSGVTAVEGRTVLVAPYSSDPGLLHLDPHEASDAMLWQAVSGMRFKMPEGYAWAPGPKGEPLPGPLPSRTQDLLAQVGAAGESPTLCQADRERVFGELRRWDVSAVLVGPMHNQGRMVALLTDLIGTTPDSVGGVFLWSRLPPVPPPGGC